MSEGRNFAGRLVVGIGRLIVGRCGEENLAPCKLGGHCNTVVVFEEMYIVGSDVEGVQ